MTEVPRVELAPGYTISRIINGCWQLMPDHGGGPDGKKDTLRRFAELVESGFTTFDCADIYTGTEELLGEFRRTLADPDAVQIHTKLVPNKMALANLDDRKIDAAIELSLSKLGVERIDLLQFHWWDYDVPGLQRLYERLLCIQQTGKIRLLGVTNFNTGKLRQLKAVGSAIATTQNQYSLLDRRPERSMLEYCQANGVSMLPYGTLAGGFLSMKYHCQPISAKVNRSLQKYRLIIEDAGGWDRFQGLLEVLGELALKHASQIESIAAKWVLDQPAVAAIILGTGRHSRADQNSSLCRLELDDADRQRITACLADLRSPPGEPFDLERDTHSPHSRIIRTELQDEKVAP